MEAVRESRGSFISEAQKVVEAVKGSVKASGASHVEAREGKSSKPVKDSLDNHEAITFRCKDVGGPSEHEFTAMCSQLEHKLLLGL